MPNIAITNYCNLKCPYCFAKDMIQEKNQSMSISDFLTVLNYYRNSNYDFIGILGGEPTLHPEFQQILNITKEFLKRNDGFRAQIFSNGIELEKYLKDLSQDFTCLLNFNSIEYVGEEKYLKILKTIKEAARLNYFGDGIITLGVNLHKDQENYDYLWNVVSLLKIDLVRCSVTSPGGKYIELRKDKNDYYSSMKNILLNFCKRAKACQCKIFFDCNRIPKCYFTEEELNIIKEVNDNPWDTYYLACSPAIDISPNLTVSSCFGTYKNNDIQYKLTDFNSFQEIERYLELKRNYTAVLKNGTGKCENCEAYKKLQCQGGCLGFAKL